MPDDYGTWDQASSQSMERVEGLPKEILKIEGDASMPPPSATEVLTLLGYERSEDNVGMMTVFLECFHLFMRRQSKRGRVWRRRGALNNLLRAGTKQDRLEFMFWENDPPGDSEDVDLDDAYDAINYMAFFVLQAMTGEWKAPK